MIDRDVMTALQWIKEQVYEVALRFAADLREPRPVEVAQLFMGLRPGTWRVVVEPDGYPQTQRGGGRFLIPFLRKDGSTFIRWMNECPAEWRELRLISGRMELFGDDPPDMNPTSETITYRRTVAGPIWYEEV